MRAPILHIPLPCKNIPKNIGIFQHRPIVLHVTLRCMMYSKHFVRSALLHPICYLHYRSLESHARVYGMISMSMICLLRFISRKLFRIYRISTKCTCSLYGTLDGNHEYEDLRLILEAFQSLFNFIRRFANGISNTELRKHE